MSVSTPVALPPSHASRRGWLIAFGIIEILIACGFLLVMAFSAFFVLRFRAPLPGAGLSSRGMLAFVVLEYGILAAAFLVGGIGSLRCRNWARILMLVLSSLWLGIGLLSTIITAFFLPVFMRQVPAGGPPGLRQGIMVTAIAFMSVLMILLPAIFLFFYSRPSVKATCLAQKTAGLPATDGAREFPIPLAILGVLQSFGVLAVCSLLFVRAAVILGAIVHGAAAVLFMLAISALSGYAAWSIFHRRLIGWKIALFYAGFGTVNMVVSYLRHPDLLQMFRDMGQNDQVLRIYEQAPQLLAVMWLGSILLMTVLLVFVLYTRKYFHTEAPQ